MGLRQEWTTLHFDAVMGRILLWILSSLDESDTEGLR